jgi:hypothetical protein
MSRKFGKEIGSMFPKPDKKHGSPLRVMHQEF